MAAPVTITVKLLGFPAVEKAFKGMQQGMRKVGEAAGVAAQKMKAVGDGMASFGKKATLFVTTPLLGAGVAAVKFASDLDEALNKSNVAFGKASAKVEEFAKTSSTSFGLSERASLDYASTLGLLLNKTGETTEATSGMSVELLKASADLASIFNVAGGAEGALEKLRAGLVGESEPLRSLGIFINDAAVQAEAFSSGIANAGEKLTEGQKILARYNLIMKGAEVAQGDFANTSDGVANSMRIVGAQLEDLGASFGKELLPFVQEALGHIKDLLTQFGELDPRTKKIIIAFSTIAAVAGPALIVLGGVVSAVSALLPVVLSVLSPIGLLITGIVGAGVAAVVLIKNLEITGAIISEVAGIAREFAIMIGEVLFPGEDVAAMWDAFATFVKDVLQQVGGFVTDFVGFASIGLKELAKFAGNVFEGIAVTAKLVFSDAESPLAKFKEALAPGDEVDNKWSRFVDNTDDRIGRISGLIKDIKSATVDDLVGLKDLILDSLVAPAEETGDAWDQFSDGFKDLDSMWEEFAEPIGDTLEVIPTQTEEAATAFELMGDRIRESTEGWLEVLEEALMSVAAGVGDMVADVIVDGENLAEAANNLLKNIAKQVISSLVQIGVQRLIAAALGSAANTSEAASSGARIGLETYGNTFSAVSAIPIVGPTLAPAAAQAALAAVTAGMAASAATGASAGAGAVGGAFAGGMENVPSTGSFLLHKGERVVQPEQNVGLGMAIDEILSGRMGGGGSITVNNTFEGEAFFDDIAEAEMRRRTVRSIETERRRSR